MAKSQSYILEIFRAKDKGFCYRIKSKNGKELLRASETYKSKTRMLEIFNKFWTSKATMRIRDNAPDMRK